MVINTDRIKMTSLLSGLEINETKRVRNIRNQGKKWSNQKDRCAKKNFLLWLVSKDIIKSIKLLVSFK